jgi:nucleotide-binding universal stress UspA family protein
MIFFAQGGSMIRSILLPLAEGPQAAIARDYAFWLAKKAGSHIRILAVIDLKSFEIPVLGTPDGFMPSVVTPPLQESRSLLADLTESARDRLEQFVRECTAREIRCSTDIRTGIPADEIARMAVAHDIVVMSRSGYNRIQEKQEKIDSLVPQVIRNSIRPVLVSGSKPRENQEIKNILVAYDGSMHSGRALLVAAELAGRTGVQCVLAAVASSEEDGNELLAPAEAFLYHHGLTPHKQVVIGSKASEIICELAAASKTDILIMGAYGHSPVREMLFGSTTERVLAHCGTTVILQS